MTWTNLDLHTETTRSVCIYSPYTAVSCVVKAANSAGVTTEIRNISTAVCAGCIVYYFLCSNAVLDFQLLI